MKLLSVSWKCHVFPTCFTNLLRIHMVLREFTMTLPSISRMHYNSVNTLWIHYESFTFERDHYLLFTTNSLSYSRIKYQFTVFAKTLWIPYLLREFTMNLLRVSRFTMNSLSFSQNNYKLTICFAILIRIHLMFPAFTMNSVGVSRIYFQFNIYFANSLWIRFVFRESTLDLLSISWIHCLYREFNKNTQSVSRIYFIFIEIIIFLREFTLNSLSIWRIHYLWHEFTMNSITFSHTHYEFTIFSRIYY